jgi:hypothetical protein
VCAGSGEAFNVGQYLEETSPYLWASTGIGLCIGFSVLGAGWCVTTHNRHRCAWRDLLCSLISSSVSSQGHIRHWLIHPRRWCQGPPHTDQESHQVCIDTCSFLETRLAKVSPAYSIIFCEVVAIYGVVRRRSPFLSFLSNPLFLFLIIVPQIIGIVYSAKLVPIEENLLYTKENHFTGSLSILSLRVCACVHDHSCQVTRSSGVD